MPEDYRERLAPSLTLPDPHREGSNASCAVNDAVSADGHVSETV
jgi:hypothetical protein